MSQDTMPQDLPFGWYIRPLDPTVTCPSPERILGTFAIINAIVTGLSIFAGHQSVVEKLTFGCIDGSGYKPWRYMFLLPIGLQLGANVVVAHVMKGAPGYDTHYSSWELMLFYTARPRLAFVALAFASLYQTTSPSQKKRAQPWISSCISNMIAEVILQLIALYIMGVTVRYGAQRDYYIIGSDNYNTLNGFTRMFYAGAMYYLVSGCISLALSLLALFLIEVDEFDACSSYTSFVCALFILVTTWMASWLFWAGFVHAAGEDYCPPRLDSQLFIWSAFGVASVVLGVGP